MREGRILVSEFYRLGLHQMQGLNHAFAFLAQDGGSTTSVILCPVVWLKIR